MPQTLSLGALRDGDSAFVTHIAAEPAMRRRLLDLGLIPGTHVTCQGRSPAGDPAAYLIRGAVIALRARDAETIAVEGARLPLRVPQALWA